jgi:hypothetical protein
LVYAICHKNGRFEGRWNGIWNLPLKIADGVNFGVLKDGDAGAGAGTEIDWLPDFCKGFTFSGDVRRTFEIGELSIDQRVFVPKFKRGVCWIFRIENRGDEKVAFKFIANPVTNLEWELKQTGDVWKEKKYLGIYDARRRMILVRHHKQPNWMMLFGSDREPEYVRCDVTDTSECVGEGSSVFPGIMSYKIEIDAGDAVEIRFVLAGGDATYHRLIEEYEEMISSTRELLGVTRKEYTSYLQSHILWKGHRVDGIWE